MQYFRGSFRALHEAIEEVWRCQDQAGIKRSRFQISAEGADTSVWTGDLSGEAMLRENLTRRSVPFDESDQQQVVTWVDGMLSSTDAGT